MKKITLALLLAPLLLLSACTAQVPSIMPAGYSIETGKKYILNPQLDEISGIAWNKDTNGFVAEEDENGIIYFLAPDFSIQKKIQFGDPGDYEDIAIDDGKIYILKSNGHITEMNYNGTGFTDIHRYKLEVDKAEYESLLLDPETKNLIMICKKSASEHKHKTTYGYTFNVNTKSFLTKPSFKLKWEDIATKAGKDIRHFRPSAAAIQPATGDWYLVSSIESLLVVVDVSTMGVKSVTHLARKDFLQPEGITFDNHSNMYITNEAAGANPVLWYFPYKKK